MRAGAQGPAIAMVGGASSLLGPLSSTDFGELLQNRGT
jgi:hypothetical protein